MLNESGNTREVELPPLDYDRYEEAEKLISQGKSCFLAQSAASNLRFQSYWLN